jgi:hypothetical protein
MRRSKHFYSLAGKTIDLPKVINTVQMVGMGMSIEHRIQLINPCFQELGPQIR